MDFVILFILIIYIIIICCLFTVTIKYHKYKNDNNIEYDNLDSYLVKL